jgi:hypothetical protein
MELFPLENENIAKLEEFISSRAVDRFMSLVSETVGLQFRYKRLITLGRGDHIDPLDTHVVDWLLGYSSVNGHDTLMPYAKNKIFEGTHHGASVLHNFPQGDWPLITALTEEA